MLIVMVLIAYITFIPYALVMLPGILASLIFSAYKYISLRVKMRRWKIERWW